MFVFALSCYVYLSLCTLLSIIGNRMLSGSGLLPSYLSLMLPRLLPVLTTCQMFVDVSLYGYLFHGSTIFILLAISIWWRCGNKHFDPLIFLEHTLCPKEISISMTKSMLANVSPLTYFRLWHSPITLMKMPWDAYWGYHKFPPPKDRHRLSIGFNEMFGSWK